MHDIDIFAVLNEEDWTEDNGDLPKPQSVLSKIKNYLDKQHDYKGKVKQDRPCVTVELSDKSFDILPAFEFGTGYRIPDYDLLSWTLSYPKTLTDSLNDANKNYSYKLKSIIKIIKYWNRLNDKIIPSYHVEEVAIKILNFTTFENYENSIRTWFNEAHHHIEDSKFKSYREYENLSTNSTKQK